MSAPPPHPDPAGDAAAPPERPVAAPTDRPVAAPTERRIAAPTERRIAAPTERRIAAPTTEGSAGPTADDAAAAQRDIAEVPAAEVVTTLAVHLMSAAAVKLGLGEGPDAAAEVDLAEARTLITALAGLVVASSPDIGSMHAAPLRDGLTALQRAFREASVIPDAPGEGPGEKWTGPVF